LNKIERGEQRLKKYPSQSQRKLMENHLLSNTNTNLNVNALNKEQTDLNQALNNFLPEWTTKNQPQVIHIFNYVSTCSIQRYVNLRNIRNS
jgi:hypothetical protein